VECLRSETEMFAQDVASWSGGEGTGEREDPRFLQVAVVALVSLAHTAVFLLAARGIEEARPRLAAPAPISVRWIETAAPTGQERPLPNPDRTPVSTVTPLPPPLAAAPVSTVTPLPPPLAAAAREPEALAVKPAVKAAKAPHRKPVLPPPSPRPPTGAASPERPAGTPPAEATRPAALVPDRRDDDPPVTPPGTDAAYLANPAPDYPAEARRAHQQGQVLLRVLVAADGHTRDLAIERGCGFPLLDNAAVTAVRQWRFTPGRRGGVAVDAWVMIPIFFALRSR